MSDDSADGGDPTPGYEGAVAILLDLASWFSAAQWQAEHQPGPDMDAINRIRRLRQSYVRAARDLDPDDAPAVAAVIENHGRRRESLRLEPAFDVNPAALGTDELDYLFRRTVVPEALMNVPSGNRSTALVLGCPPRSAAAGEIARALRDWPEQRWPTVIDPSQYRVYHPHSWDLLRVNAPELRAAVDGEVRTWIAAAMDVASARGCDVLLAVRSDRPADTDRSAQTLAAAGYAVTTRTLHTP